MNKDRERGIFYTFIKNNFIMCILLDVLHICALVDSVSQNENNKKQNKCINSGASVVNNLPLQNLKIT